MNIEEFNALDTIERAAQLHKEGKEITTCVTLDNVYALYFLGNFYVEIVFDAYMEEYIEVVAFKNGERFDKYLTMNIDLPSI